MLQRFSIGIIVLILSVATNGSVAFEITDLLPRPQVWEERDGSFQYKLDDLYFHITAESAEAGERLAGHLQETYERLGLELDTSHIAVDQGQAFTLSAGERFLTTPLSTENFPAVARDQGYDLRINPQAITVRALSEVGLFYGLVTFEQIANSTLVRGKKRLDCIRIFDWPQIEKRGFSEDYGRNQLPTMEDHKRSIRNFSRFKMNTYLFFIESDHFVYDFDPELGNEYDRFRFDELKEIVAYAKRYYIEVIPTVELLGHMEMTLSNPKYKHLAEVDGLWDLCATCDDSFELVKNMVSEIAPAFESKFFHAGLDESWHIGKGRSKEIVEKYGIEKVIRDYYIKMNDLVHSYGKSLMMYADIAVKYPGCLEGLPKDIHMMFWGYTPRDHYVDVDVLLKAGFPVITLSGLADWNEIYPVYDMSLKNVDTLAKQTAQSDAYGHFVSSWGDPFRGAAGTNLSEWNNYGVAYCCSIGWNPQPIPIPDYSGPFAVQFFGSDSPELAEALTLLAQCQSGRSHLARRTFQSDPKALVDKWESMDADELAYWKKLRTDAQRAHQLLRKIEVPRNSTCLAATDISARMLTFTGRMVFLCREVGKSAKGSNPDTQKYAEKFDKLIKRYEILWRDYRNAYLETNRPINIEHIGKVWDLMYGELESLRNDLRSGTYTPNKAEK